MLETIFTGHTIQMIDLVAIGPILEQQKAVSPVSGVRSLVIELYVRDAPLIRHVALSQEILGGPMPYQDVEWNLAMDELTEKRQRLESSWAQSLLSLAEKEIS